MEKSRVDGKPSATPACCNKGVRMEQQMAKKPEPSTKKGWWSRYTSRLKKHEGEVRSCCR